MKTGINNVVLPTFLYVVKAILNNIIECNNANNIVDNIEQCGQQKNFSVLVSSALTRLIIFLLCKTNKNNTCARVDWRKY